MSQIGCCGGVVDKGTPTGSVQTIAGIQCYLAEYSGDEKKNDDVLIVIATDIFGYTLPNSRLIADGLANEFKTKCVVPDLFQG